MKNKKVLIVRNISREGPGLLQSVLAENDVRSHTVELDRRDEFPDPTDYSALFVFGGPGSANDETPKMRDELRKAKEAVEVGMPYLGVCLGMQMLVKANGGEVFPHIAKEVGWRDRDGQFYEVHLTPEGHRDPIFGGLESPLKVFQLHAETIRLVDNMFLLGTGKYCRNQVVRVGRTAYGIQGHFELTASMLEEWIRLDADLKPIDSESLRKDYESVEHGYKKQGRQIFKNFLTIAGLAH